jgi:ribosomal-protein-serine acetyltransferase
MTATTWKTDTIADILSEEFYALIDRNREHISKTFPVTLRGCADLESTKKFIGEAIDNQIWSENFYFYMRNTATNNLIGYIVVKNINMDISKCELGYFVDKDYQGRGIISKAVANALDYCFDELQMNKVTICTSLTNAASQRVATKHGFIQEGILREEFKNIEGLMEDIVYFGLLKSAYQNER